MFKFYKLFIIALFFILNGCASKEYIYINTNAKCLKKTSKLIAIDEIKLPYYMNDFEVMELKENKLVPTKKYLSKDPTDIIITKLSNKLCDPNVFLYPWGKNVDYKIDVKIDDFYFKDSKIYINARIYINSKYKKLIIIKKCKREYNCVNDAFEKIIDDISKEIK